MTNQQLTAARRVMNRYPALGIHKNGETLEPYRLQGGTVGTAVVVVSTTTPAQIEAMLEASCRGLNA